MVCVIDVNWLQNHCYDYQLSTDKRLRAHLLVHHQQLLLHSRTLWQQNTCKNFPGGIWNSDKSQKHVPVTTNSPVNVRNVNTLEIYALPWWINYLPQLKWSSSVPLWLFFILHEQKSSEDGFLKSWAHYASHFCSRLKMGERLWAVLQHKLVDRTTILIIKGYFNVKHISQSAPCTTNYI